VNVNNNMIFDHGWLMLFQVITWGDFIWPFVVLLPITIASAFRGVRLRIVLTVLVAAIFVEFVVWELLAVYGYHQEVTRMDLIYAARLTLIEAAVVVFVQLVVFLGLRKLRST
jgi:hypothetical protein